MQDLSPPVSSYFRLQIRVAFNNHDLVHPKIMSAHFVPHAVDLFYILFFRDAFYILLELRFGVSTTRLTKYEMWGLR